MVAPLRPALRVVAGHVPSTSTTAHVGTPGVPVRPDIRPRALAQVAVPVAVDPFEAVGNKGPRGALAIQVVAVPKVAIAPPAAALHARPDVPDGHVVGPVVPSLETKAARARRTVQDIPQTRPCDANALGGLVLPATFSSRRPVAPLDVVRVVVSQVGGPARLLDGRLVPVLARPGAKVDLVLRVGVGTRRLPLDVDET